MKMSDTYNRRINDFRNKLKIPLDRTHLYPNINVGIDSENQLNNYVKKVNNTINMKNNLEVIFSDK